MTIRSRTYLKTKFETGDTPTQDDFVDLIESLSHKQEDVLLFGLPDFDAGKTWAVGEKFVYLDKIYRVSTSFTGAFDDTKTVELSATANEFGIPSYDNLVEYAIGDYVEYQKLLYRATAITQGNLPTDVTKWEEISGSDGSFGTPYQTGLYKIGNTILYDGLLFKLSATAPVDGNGNYESTNIISDVNNGYFELISGTRVWITDRRYYTGEVIINAGKFYKALTSHTSGVFATDLAALKWEVMASGVSSVNTLSGDVVLTTTNINEGTNLYFTASRVWNTVLTGLSLASGAAITAADSMLVAFGKLQKQITDIITSVGLKQDTLVSGTNIKTVNGNTILGSGDFKLQAYANTTIVSHTGSLITTVVSSFVIPANTFKAGDILDIGLLFDKTGNTTTDTWQVTLNGVLIIQESLGGANKSLRVNVLGFINAISGAANFPIWQSSAARVIVFNTNLNNLTIDFTTPITVETTVQLGDVSTISRHICTSVNKK